MAGDPEPKVGDEVAWNWGSSHIEGEVAEKTTDKLTKQIKGKPITKNGEPDNPAYFVKQTQKSGNPVVKKASELELLESKGEDDSKDDDKAEADKEESDDKEDKAAAKKSDGKKTAAKSKGKQNNKATGNRETRQTTKDATAKSKDDAKADGKDQKAAQAKGNKGAAGKKHEREEEKEEEAEAELSDASEEEAEENGSAGKPKAKKVKKQAPPTNQHVKTKAGTERKQKASAAQNKKKA